MRYGVVCLIGLLLSIRVQAAEIVWIELIPEFSYKDLWVFCTNSNFPSQFYLSAELEGTKVTKAILHSRNSSVSPSKIELTSVELQGLELEVDKTHRVWVRDLPYNRRLLEWTFYRTSYVHGCSPSQALLTVNPPSVLYKFDLANCEEETQIGSETVKFVGTLKDKSSFEAALSWTERPMTFEVPW